jgi:AcrR family transcriptional regulator
MTPDEQAKERILLLASERFLKEGFVHVSVDELAADLGMSKKTLYKHFKSKDALFEQFIDRMTGEMHRQIRAITDLDCPFIEKIDRFMRLLAETAGRMGKPLMRDMQRHKPEIWNRVENFRRERIRQNFRAMLAHGVTEGHVRPELNIDLVVVCFLATIESVINPGVLLSHSFSTREAIQGILRIYFHGILTEDASSQLRVIQDGPTIP